MTAPFAKPSEPKLMTVRELLAELEKVPEKDRDALVFKSHFVPGEGCKTEPVFEVPNVAKDGTRKLLVLY